MERRGYDPVPQGSPISSASLGVAALRTGSDMKPFDFLKTRAFSSVLKALDER